jgi:hypothetical protein
MQLFRLRRLRNFIRLECVERQPTNDAIFFAGCNHKWRTWIMLQRLIRTFLDSATAFALPVILLA